MTKRVPLVLLMLVLICAFAFSQARGQASGFVISGADGINTLAFNSSSALDTLIGQVSPHFIIENANGTLFENLTLSSDLQSAIAGIAPRIIYEFANASFNTSLAYPVELIGDTFPPEVTNLVANSSGQISWITDEFTLGIIRYGTQSGNYPDRYQETDYSKQHQVILTGLSEGTTIYFRVRNTDQSGNSIESSEQTFTYEVPKDLYLPLVRK